MKNKGFTLVELLVVISIISVLSSTVMYSTAQARVKADDAKKQAEVHQVQVAISLQKDTTKKTPLNYNCAGTYCASGTGDSVAVEGTQAFNASMQELVDKGYISSIPKSKDNSYVYYADANADQATFGAKLNSPSAPMTNNYCPTTPAPYQDCKKTTSSFSPATPYYTGADVVNFYSPTGTNSFCKIYGDPSCNPSGNAVYASACPKSTQFPPGSGNFMCPTSIYVTISCKLKANSVATCSGGGTDSCACI